MKLYELLEKLYSDVKVDVNILVGQQFDLLFSGTSLEVYNDIFLNHYDYFKSAILKIVVYNKKLVIFIE